MDATKPAVRAWARAQPSVDDAESAAVIASLVGWLAGRDGGVLTYLSMPGEIAAEQLAGRVAQPLFTTRTPSVGPLTLHPIEAPRERHGYGFEQPRADAPLVDPARIGIVLVPGLAFDARGGRLGRGKGYYDRLLATLPGRLRVGITLDRFVIEAVPTDPWDLPMTHLVTESGVAACP